MFEDMKHLQVDRKSPEIQEEKKPEAKANSGDLIAAVDIGTTKICAMVGRVNKYGKIEIVAESKTTSLGVIRGMVFNIADTTRSIQKVITDVQRKVGKDIDQVFVGIAGQHIRSLKINSIYTRPNPDALIGHEDIRQLRDFVCKYPIDGSDCIIDILPQEFTIDNESGIQDPHGYMGARIEANFHVITGKISAVRHIQRSVEDAGLKIEGITLEPLASAASVLSAEEKEAGVVLVDIGGGTTDIAIFKDHLIRHTAVVPMAGEFITGDIKQGLQITKTQAESLKIQHGSALATKEMENQFIVIPVTQRSDKKEICRYTLAEIIRFRMEEILIAVMQQIDSSGLRNELGGGIVLTGGGSQLLHLPHLVSLFTGIKARVGYPLEHLTLKREHSWQHPMYATGIGLLIRGHEHRMRESFTRSMENIVAPAEAKPTVENLEMPNDSDPSDLDSNDPSHEPAKPKNWPNWINRFLDLMGNNEMPK